MGIFPGFPVYIGWPIPQRGMNLIPETPKPVRILEPPSFVRDRLLPWAKHDYFSGEGFWALRQEAGFNEFSLALMQFETAEPCKILIKPEPGALLLAFLPGENRCRLIQTESNLEFPKGISEQIFIETGYPLTEDFIFKRPDKTSYSSVPIGWQMNIVLSSIRNLRLEGSHLALELRICVLRLFQLYMAAAEAAIRDRQLVQVPKRELYLRIRDHILSSPHIHEHEVGRLARRFAVSESLIAKNFKKIFGQSPAKFVREHALEKARQLILTSTLTIEEIAMEVGYSEGNNFYPAFKKKYGVSPAALRKHGV